MLSISIDAQQNRETETRIGRSQASIALAVSSVVCAVFPEVADCNNPTYTLANAVEAGVK